MRLVRDEDETSVAESAGAPAAAVVAPPLIAPAAEGDAALSPVLDHLGEMQQEIKALQSELEALRQRDAALRFYMQRIDEELRLAARIQQDFLPKILPQVGRVYFHTLFRPAGYVSGDLYDVMRLDERHVGFFICDAVGHGMPAALLTMFIKRALVTKEILGNGYRLLDPGETIARLNDALLEQHLSQATYATALYGVVDTESLRLRFAKGGHPCPAVLRADGRLEFPDASGALLGIFPQEPFEVREIQLAPGDRLFVYSDGIEVGFCGDNVADNQRWQHELQSRREMPTDALLQDLSAALDRQSGSLSPKDDLTMVAVEVR
jgi:sigma-B regulation protein RsbU (phosphoserine phosphatase)